MLRLVAYDIPDDKRRTRISKILQDYITRVQYSVFEGILDNKMFLEMQSRVKDEVDEGEDSVRFYTLCASCSDSVCIMGKGEVSEIEEIFLI